MSPGSGTTGEPPFILSMDKMMIDENRRERLQCLESRIRDNR